MTSIPKIKLESVDRFERDYKLRLPFRFGVITVTEGTQAVIRAKIALEDGRTAVGVAAEALGAKWFDKSPAFSDAQNLDQLRQALGLAIELYRARGWSTPFGLYADTYKDQLARGAELGLVPLVASYGPALLDRAILDALGRATELSFADMIRRNLAGIEATDLTPDLAGYDLPRFLDRLRPGRDIAVRHTVGLVDPIVAADQAPADRVNDGLPETLEEVVRHYRGRYYKLKVAGNIEADLARLTQIAAVLDRDAGDYRATLDGNEQYDSVDGIAELWRRMRETPALERLVAATLFIEQPIKRASALQKLGRCAGQAEAAHHRRVRWRAGDVPGGAEARLQRRLQQELQGALQIHPQRRPRRQAQCAKPARHKYFMSAEDLTTLAGVSVQQDLALVSLLGLTHVERNGHHFIDGMSFAPEREQAAFARAHPDLYDRSAGPARLRIEGGRLALGSLACPGFAVAADMDFAAMRPMPAAPRGRIAPAFPEKAA